MKRLAVLAATHSDGYTFSSNMTSVSGAQAGPSLHGNVNILLSGWVNCYKRRAAISLISLAQYRTKKFGGENTQATGVTTQETLRNEDYWTINVRIAEGVP
jgi:hypothetical protein